MILFSHRLMASVYFSIIHFHTCQCWNHYRMAIFICLLKIKYSIYCIDFFGSKCFNSSFLRNLMNFRWNFSLFEFSFDKYFSYHWFIKGTYFRACSMSNNCWFFHFNNFDLMKFWFINYLLCYFDRIEFFEDVIQLIYLRKLIFNFKVISSCNFKCCSIPSSGLYYSLKRCLIHTCYLVDLKWFIGGNIGFIGFINFSDQDSACLLGWNSL